MPRLAPGRYVLHVTINENRGNPARFPGDYDVFHRFEVPPDGAVELRVDMAKLIRLRSPWDNGQDMAGMLDAALVGEALAHHQSTVVNRRRHLLVGSGGVGSYLHLFRRDDARSTLRARRRGRSHSTACEDVNHAAAAQVPSPDTFSSSDCRPHKGGHQVGELLTHDSGAPAWTAMFTRARPIVGGDDRRPVARERPVADSSFARDVQSGVEGTPEAVVVGQCSALTARRNPVQLAT